MKLISSASVPASDLNILKPLSNNEENILNSLTTFSTDQAQSSIQDPSVNLTNFLNQNTPSKTRTSSSIKKTSIKPKTPGKPPVIKPTPLFTSVTLPRLSTPASTLSAVHTEEDSEIPVGAEDSIPGFRPVPLSSEKSSPPHPFIHSIPKVSSPLCSSRRRESPAPTKPRASDTTLLRDVLVKGLQEVVINKGRHPRLATVLVNRRNGRAQPYSHDYRKRTQSRYASPQPDAHADTLTTPRTQSQPPVLPFAAHFDNTQSTLPSRSKKFSPRLPYLPREVQEASLRGALRHLARSPSSPPSPAREAPRSDGLERPDGRISTPKLPSLPASPRTPSPSLDFHATLSLPPPHLAIEASPPDIAELPPEADCVAVDVADLRAAIVALRLEVYPGSGKGGSGTLTARVLFEPSVEPVSRPATPTPLPSFTASTEELNVRAEPVTTEEGPTVEDEGTDTDYDQCAHDINDTAQEEATPAALPPIAVIASVRDEGYEGSETSDGEIDELDDEGIELDTHQIPAYRQPALARPQPSSPTLLVPPPQLPRAPPKDPREVLFLDPKKRKHDLVDEPTGGASKRPRNWAYTERELLPAPEPREGWDKTKRVSKNVEQSRGFYSDPAAKAVSAPGKTPNLVLKPFRDWIASIREWLKTGDVLHNGDHVGEEEKQGRARSYSRSVKLAVKADEGLILGVKKAKPATLVESGLSQFVLQAKANVDAVDERWGKEAMALKSNIEEYWRVVAGRC